MQFLLTTMRIWSMRAMTSERPSYHYYIIWAFTDLSSYFKFMNAIKFRANYTHTHSPHSDLNPRISPMSADTNCKIKGVERIFLLPIHCNDLFHNFRGKSYLQKNNEKKIQYQKLDMVAHAGNPIT